MEELLKNPIVKAVLAITILVVLARVAVKLFTKPKADNMHLKVKCKKCGWQGMVGKYNRRCYSCNGTDITILKPSP